MDRERYIQIMNDLAQSSKGQFPARNIVSPWHFNGRFIEVLNSFGLADGQPQHIRCLEFRMASDQV